MIIIFLLLFLPILCFSEDTSILNRCNPNFYNVKDFGATGDGIQDDTEYIQNTLNIAGKNGGGIVYLPIGNYLIKGHLLVPENVTLEGVWRAPFRGDPTKAGSVLLAVSGKGEENGEALIKVSTSSTLKGFAVYYPEQIREYPPIPYPWTVQSNGPADDVSLIDLTLINPYKAIDFGTYPTGRHKIKNLHAYPLYRGIYINQCYDVGRLENIHLWPFWDLDPNSPLWKFTKDNGIAFIIGKTDGEMGINLFSIFYSIGMHFINGPIFDEKGNVMKHLPGSGTYTNCYMDITPCAVKIESAMENAGITFVNSSFMSKVVVSPNNYGPIKFIGCGFWGIEGLDYQTYLEGKGSITFEGCHFSGWDRKYKGFPCIYANTRDILITGCEFLNSQINYPLIHLGANVRNALITANISQSRFEIKNETFKGASVIVENNLGKDNNHCITEWVIIGPFLNLGNNSTQALQNSKEITNEQFNNDYLQSIGGENVIELNVKMIYEKFSKVISDGNVKVKTLKNSTKEPVIKLHKFFGEVPGIAYAYTYINSPRAQKILFELGMNDGGAVFINGKKVYERLSSEGVSYKRGYDSFISEVKKGKNFILLKLENKGGKWEYIFEAIPEKTKQLKFYTK
ncbi:MAG: glycoside hydrolase family 55 protein [Candidatus Hydrogenedentes bacterium]|nr:glycoside hydrolase family 55 protein [Candidatus Hydrogenedentota bacterium]